MVSQTEIHNVQFPIGFQKLFSDDVETICRVENKGFRKGLDIIAHGIW